MISINNYKKGSLNSNSDTVKNNENALFSQRVLEFIKTLNQNKELIQKEFESLAKNYEKAPNNVFPIKMDAWKEMYDSIEVLNEWYILRGKK